MESKQDGKEEKQKEKDPRIDRIHALEREIEDWRSHNSQSNPGAVMELRSMKKRIGNAQEGIRH
jgi:hypothetical protein